MASPMVEGRSPRVLDPHKKAHFSLHVSDRISSPPSSLPSFASVKYNHKPAQLTSVRNTTLTSTSNDRYNLKVEDKAGGKNQDVFVFTGQRTSPTRQFVLIFDPASQKATLEPLASTYTFNILSKNNTDVSSSYTRIYPKRTKTDSQDAHVGGDDLFDEGAQDHADDDPDPSNPYDFRHFLRKEGEKRGDESEYATPSSPDYRTSTGSAMNTPVFQARKPASAATSKAEPSQPARRRKSPEPLVSRKPTQKKQGPPTVRLDRRASTHPKSETAAKRKPTSKPAAPPSSKVKSEEFIQDSDDSDLDAPASPDLASSPVPVPQRSPSPVQNEDEDEDQDTHAGGGRGGLEIEVPDARPNTKRKALASLGLGQSLGLGGLSRLHSPNNGPISLAEAASSVEGSPDPQYLASSKGGRAPKASQDDDVIDFGSYGGNAGDGESEDEDADGEEEEEVDDRDVEPMDIGPPAAQAHPARKMSMAGLPAPEEDEDDPLYQEMMQGLAGDSSEESEEE